MSLLRYGALFLLFVLLVSWWRGLFHSPPPVHIVSWVAPGWEPLLEDYKKNQASGVDKGSSLAVYYKGELVVDIYGGYMNTYRKWTADSLSIVMSVTKALTALCAAILVDKGHLDYNRTVASYWPEFAANGKADITVDQLLSHSAGLVGLDEPGVTTHQVRDEPHLVAKALANQKPAWTPGNHHGYHALTFGLYVDQLIRHADPQNRGLQQFFAQEIADKHGLDIYIGLPRTLFHRAARLHPLPFGGMIHMLSDFAWFRMVLTLMTNPQIINCISDFSDKLGSPYDPEFLDVPLGSANGVSNAKSLARLFAALSLKSRTVPGSKNKTPILSEKVKDLFFQPLRSGYDKIILMNITWGRGVGCKFGNAPLEINKMLPTSTVSHLGAGGQILLADRQQELSLAYVTNHFHPYFDLNNPIHDSFLRTAYQIVKNKK